MKFVSHKVCLIAHVGVVVVSSPYSQRASAYPAIQHLLCGQRLSHVTSLTGTDHPILSQLEATMGKINWGRVIAGGIVAGIIINIFEYVTNGRVLAADWAAAMQSLGRQMPPSAVPIFIVWGFLVGISAIWLYAAARTRFGAGPGTAVLTGFAYWVIGYLFPNLVNWALAIFPNRLLGITTIVGLVELILASLAGASIYKERATP
jgi:hypothetical protein